VWTQPLIRAAAAADANTSKDLAAQLVLLHRSGKVQAAVLSPRVLRSHRSRTPQLSWLTPCLAVSSHACSGCGACSRRTRHCSATVWRSLLLRHHQRQQRRALVAAASQAEAPSLTQPGPRRLCILVRTVGPKLTLARPPG
jgi:hypothetical protein